MLLANTMAFARVKAARGSSRGLCRKMQNMCALQREFARWINGGETDASSADSKNVLPLEW